MQKRSVDIFSAVILLIVSCVLIWQVIVYVTIDESVVNIITILLSLLVVMLCYICVGLVRNSGVSTRTGFAGDIGWQVRLILSILLVLFVVLFLFGHVNIFIFITTIAIIGSQF